MLGLGRLLAQEIDCAQLASCEIPLGFEMAGGGACGVLASGKALSLTGLIGRDKVAES
ncbi:hypothetical protein J31TS3_49550 [Paenibacillus lactis]|nr:hypothetical protein J31TS3_49550 [Paenibacillus lactis]